MIERGRWLLAKVGQSLDDKLAKWCRVCVTASGSVFVTGRSGDQVSFRQEMILEEERTDGVLHVSFLIHGGDKKSPSVIASERYIWDFREET